MEIKNVKPLILRDFLNYIYNVRNYSISTVRAYHSDLISFFKFIKEYRKLDVEIKDFNTFILLQVHRRDVIAFLVYLNFNKNNNPYTRQRNLSAIRSFYKWLLSNFPNDNIENPTNTVGNIIKVERLPKYLNLKQAKQIQTIFTKYNTNYPHRNNAIISLLLNTGMRVGELVKVNMEDIDFNTNTIIINSGKNKKTRNVYFSSSCKELLLQYIKLKEKYCKTTSNALFINKRNNRLGIDGIEDVCKKAYKLMGLEKFNYTAHTLRHTAATLMYKYNNKDLLLVKEFLGHSNISSTEIYTHVLTEELRDALERNPLNNL